MLRRSAVRQLFIFGKHDGYIPLEKPKHWRRPILRLASPGSNIRDTWDSSKNPEITARALLDFMGTENEPESR